MSRVVSAFLFGALFGAGLLLSGMTDPARVIGFLNVAGKWNPALAFVMIGAIAVAAPAFARARAHPTAALGGAIILPGRTLIDRRLIGGAVLFGVGWGLSGVCPGPAVVLLGQDGLAAATFFAALLVGSFIAGAFARSR